LTIIFNMSEKTLNPATLNDSARDYLEEILAKDLNSLTVYDIGFLKARVAYLTADQREFFSDALKGKIKGIDFVEEDEEEVAPKKVREVKVDEDGKKIIDPNDYDQKTLIQMCKDADLKFDPKMNKQQLADLLNER